MRWNIIRIAFCFVFLTVNCSPSLLLSKGITEEEESKRIADHFAEPEIIKLPGNYLRAIMVACEDFQQIIKRYEKDSRPFAVFSSKIDNYLITITKKKGSHNYHIWFQKKPFKRELLKGGDGVYIIEESTFKIIEKKY